jgi:hypothetical protein
VTRRARLAPLVEEEMLRVLLYVSLIGAWEPATVPLHAPDASSTETTKAKKGEKGKNAERHKKRDKKGQ